MGYLRVRKEQIWGTERPGKEKGREVCYKYPSHFTRWDGV